MSLVGSRIRLLTPVLLALFLSSCASSPKPDTEDANSASQAEVYVDPLPSWSDTAAKAKIIDFVSAVTDPENPAFVERNARIATFDNDGTLWVEKPIYAEMAFALDRIRSLARVHPEWKTQQPFKAVLEGDRDAFVATGRRGVADVLMASHTGMGTTLFDAIAAEWIRDARHPDLGKPYTELVYQPQLELLRYLEAKGFTVLIVSGGSVEFLRTFTEEIYGIPPEQVVGSSVLSRYEVQGGKPSLLRVPELSFVNDGPGKPVGIHRRIGRAPILAFGNSDGDFEMLEWTTVGGGDGRLGLILHHDDAEREYAYDRESGVGTLSRALDEAGNAGWVVVSMKNDWKTVFSEE